MPHRMGDHVQAGGVGATNTPRTSSLRLHRLLDGPIVTRCVHVCFCMCLRLSECLCLCVLRRCLSTRFLLFTCVCACTCCCWGTPRTCRLRDVNTRPCRSRRQRVEPRRGKRARHPRRVPHPRRRPLRDAAAVIHHLNVREWVRTVQRRCFGVVVLAGAAAPSGVPLARHVRHRHPDNVAVRIGGRPRRHRGVPAHSPGVGPRH